MLIVEEKKEFTLRGKKISVSKDDVLKILSKYKEELYPQKGQLSNYYLVIEGKFVPIKKALLFLLENLGYDFTILDFVTQDAVRIFRTLGFSIVVGKGNKNLLKSFIGSLSLQGNAIEDKKNIYE
ncbi:hypothetical protein [Thermodesulfovibrio yellowstonii]|uniref:Uncharacterized protein n=1 Tax=Thermodesulfovibrio yellowstonii TaxID=28262 RepID=A0A9W6GFH2_9BACT|nr:hypothetical protein [Thermodesulfovibrio islandicus]GLI52931.1 hypothetical protein TISLANDTSLP1_06240 [Thermodesulfovibrio islandicus]